MASARDGTAGRGEYDRERERDAEIARARAAARPSGPRGAPTAAAGGNGPRGGAMAVEAMVEWDTGKSKRKARARGGN